METFFLYFLEAKKKSFEEIKKTYNARNQNGVHKVLQVGYKEVEKCVVFFKKLKIKGVGSHFVIYTYPLCKDIMIFNFSFFFINIFL